MIPQGYISDIFKVFHWTYYFKHHKAITILLSRNYKLGELFLIVD